MCPARPLTQLKHLRRQHRILSASARRPRHQVHVACARDTAWHLACIAAAKLRQTRVFSLSEHGGRARANGGHCVFCTPAPMQEAAQDPKKYRKVPDIYEKALRRLRKNLTIEEYKKVVTPHNFCRGTGEDMCMFNTKHPGMPARVTKDGNHLCSWCDKERLRELPILKRCGLEKQLQAFRENDELVFAKAEQILKEIFGEAYQVQLERKESREHQQIRRRSGHTAEQWTEALKKRKYVAEAPAEDEEARRKYRSKESREFVLP